MKCKLLSLMILGMSFYISGCLEVEESVTILKYNPDKGSGIYKQTFISIRDEDTSAKKTKVLNKKDLLKMLDNMKDVLKSAGMKNVKGKLKRNSDTKSYDAEISGKFLSLAQLPILDSIKLSFKEVERKIGKKEFGRMDKVIEFNVESEDLISLGKKSTFIFESADRKAKIVEHNPRGRISRLGRRISWQIDSKNKEVQTFKVQLRGTLFRKN
jgi:hypothetical protein